MNNTAKHPTPKPLYNKYLPAWYNILLIQDLIKLSEAPHYEITSNFTSTVSKKFDTASIRKGYKILPNVFACVCETVYIKHPADIDVWLNGKDEQYILTVRMFIEYLVSVYNLTEVPDIQIRVVTKKSQKKRKNKKQTPAKPKEAQESKSCPGH
jgi:hypothetical protein